MRVIWRIKILLFLILVGLALPVQAQDFVNRCERFSYKKSLPEHRRELLEEVQATILTDLDRSDTSLRDFYYQLKSCNDLSCQKLISSLMIRTREQSKLAKFAKAIASRGIGLFGKVRSPKTLKDFVYRKQHGFLHRESVVNFNVKGHSFTNNEKDEAFELWWKVFIPIAHDMGRNANVFDVFVKTQEFFAQANKSLLNMNPILTFVTEKDLQSRQAFLKVFEKMIGFNGKFKNHIKKYKTDHSTSLVSYVNNLFTADHEMGLVNFENQAMAVISTVGSQDDVNLMCSAWQDLKHQQNLRVQASIGVGFVESVICGVGTLSIVGTGPAIALCAASFADSFVGAYRGARDARIAYLGKYAGREIKNSGEFTESVVSLEDSRIIQSTGTTVFLLNAFSLFPVLKIVKNAHDKAKFIKQGKAFSKPKIKDYVLLPVTDSVGSGAETAAAPIAYLLIASKGLEFFSDEFAELMAEIQVDWP